MDLLVPECVLLGAHAADKFDAVRQAGELLVKAGYVGTAYVDGMLARERRVSTFLGHGIAIPHGEGEDLASVFCTGVSVLQVADGVEWDPGEFVYLVIGLAATPTSQEHVIVLSNLLQMLDTPQAIPQLVQATDPAVIIDRLAR